MGCSREETLHLQFVQEGQGGQQQNPMENDTGESLGQAGPDIRGLKRGVTVLHHVNVALCFPSTERSCGQEDKRVLLATFMFVSTHTPRGAKFLPKPHTKALLPLVPTGTFFEQYILLKIV